MAVVIDRRPKLDRMARPEAAGRPSDAVDGPFDYLWLLDSHATTRPDAPAALVDAAESLEAS